MKSLRLPRFRICTLMVAVAVVAGLLAIARSEWGRLILPVSEWGLLILLVTEAILGLAIAGHALGCAIVWAAKAIWAVKARQPDPPPPK